MNPRFLSWFATHAWTPFEFQKQAWAAYRAGASGLVNAPTGMGKTLAVWGGPLLDWLESPPAGSCGKAPPLTVLWLTPLRALASDTAANLCVPLEALGMPWTLGLRTGDTSASLRAKQRQRMPTCLITTPESLSLLLSYPDHAEKFADLRCVIVDEWHELMSTKRGVQVELGLARLRRLRPGLRTWGLSATLGNLEQAMGVLLGDGASTGRLIIAADHKAFELRTLLPPDMERFPWAGHLGTRMLPQVLEVLLQARSTLLFTNTRSQAEIWFRAIMRERPEWIGQVALHHGSLERSLRERVEDLLRAGALRCVVCTSSLDLGVDFSPVDQVVQVGSPKGIARLLQRAGRSGHQPDGVSRIVCVPTHAFELVEFAAARTAAGGRRIECRPPVERPLDVLTQHLVTVALGGGFVEEELFAEVRSTHAFGGLTEPEWRWAVDFVSRGGPALRAYTQYAKVVPHEGRYLAPCPRIARLHRMAIGTITSDSVMQVKLMTGRYLGTIEEGFISRLKPGDRFVFAGMTLELVMTEGMTAFARKTPRGGGRVPQWLGARFPMSTQLADAVRMKLEQHATAGEEEMRHVAPVLELQGRWSSIPQADELLIESARTAEGYHQCVFPFEGRLVHEGLATLIAYRLARRKPRSIILSVNDYGFHLLSPQPLRLGEEDWRKLLATRRLLEDLLGCLNAAQMARRQFREIARVAGLVFPGFPGSGKTARQLQASSELFFDVLQEFDPGNLLLDQARREVLERELEFQRMQAALERMQVLKLVQRRTPHLTPLAFPLWAEFVRGQVSSERWIDRVERMAGHLEAAAQEDKGQGKANRAQTRVYG